MARLTNARNNHITRWVIPAARKLLIDALCSNMPTRPLDEVAYIEMGQSPSGDSCNDNNDGVPLIGGPADLGLVFPQTTRWTNAPTKLCQIGDIIVCVRATIGEPRWADAVYCLGRGVASIRPTDPNLDAQFLFRVIEGNEQWLQNQGTGTAFKTISKQHLAAIRIPLIPKEQQKAASSFLAWLEQNANNNTRPNFFEAPLLPEAIADQRRIVARIEELAAKIEEARGLRRETAEELKSLPMANAKVTLGEKPTESWQPLKIFVAEIENGWSPLCENRPATNDEWGVLKLGAVSFGIYNESENKALPFDLDPKPEYEVRPGDFLMSRANTTNLVGACAVVEQTRSKLTISDKIFRFRFRFREGVAIEQHYLAYILKSPALRFQIESNATGTSSTMKNISKEKVLDLLIPHHTLDEQRRIVAHLDALQARVDALRRIQAASSAELNALLPSILDKAFKGEL